MLDLHRMFTETDFRPELRKISVPMLLIHRDNDTSTPIETTATQNSTTDGGLPTEGLRGCGTQVPITHADHLNQDLRAFANS